MTEPLEPNTMCELASLAGLGALDRDDVWRLREHLLSCSVCRDELAAAEHVASLLGFAAEPVAPSPLLRFRLFDKIEGRSRTLADDIPLGEAAGWQPFPIPGVVFRKLHLDKQTREVVLLVKADAGVHYPTHEHSGVEEMFMLEGELDFDGTVYKAGDYVRSEAGTVHSSSETRTGCMFLMRASLDNKMLALN